jgi:hypothetical protein
LESERPRLKFLSTCNQLITLDKLLNSPEPQFPLPEREAITTITRGCCRPGEDTKGRIWYPAEPELDNTFFSMLVTICFETESKSQHSL